MKKKLKTKQKAGEQQQQTRFETSDKRVGGVDVNQKQLLEVEELKFQSEKHQKEGGSNNNKNSNNKENACPVCGTDLRVISSTEVGVNAHVNACLEKTSRRAEVEASAAAAAKETSKETCKRLKYPRPTAAPKPPSPSLAPAPAPAPATPTTQGIGEDKGKAGGGVSLTYGERMEAVRRYAAGASRKGKERRMHSYTHIHTHTYTHQYDDGKSRENLVQDNKSIPIIHPHKKENTSGAAATAARSTPRAAKGPPQEKTKYWGMWRSHVILGTPGPFAVDCFKGKQSATLHKEGTCSWFLSHFHYDHYIGLKKDFDKGQIYCTKTTAKLVHHIIGVPLEVISIVTIGQPVVVEGVKVTPLDANHCPGACMFLFEPAGEIPTLHTGDCRLSGDKMQAMPTLAKVRGNVKLILDTTYCNPKYTFPPQEKVVEAAARVVCAELASNPKALVLVGSYTIGKEVVFLRIAKALGCKIYIGANKRRAIKCLDEYLSEQERTLITFDDTETNLHVVPMGQLSQQRMEGILKHYKNKYTGVIAIRPTGWSIDSSGGSSNSSEGITRRKKGKTLTYSVPYSEHSGYDEMSNFVNWLQPKEIIPFVRIQDQDAFLSLLKIASNRT